MSKKKILIFGPIADIGGREVEVNFIAKTLCTDYEVCILSSAYMTEDSFALQGIDNMQWHSLPKLLYRKNNSIKWASRISKIANRGNKKSYGYVHNSLVKRLYDLKKIYTENIIHQLQNIDLVILCTQLSSQFLPEIIDYCHQNNIPTLLRTTGTIRSISEKDKDFLKKVSLFIHHSNSNAERLNNQMSLPFAIIDQSASSEVQLLNLPIKMESPLRFGYLGRLSEEKGILPLVDFFNSTKLPLLIVGDGPLKQTILHQIEGNKSIKHLEQLPSHQLESFFNQIDVLVIPSYEESGPLVGLEAMAAGKIILSTRVGAMEDRLADTKNNFWFAIENSATLMAKIEELQQFTREELKAIAQSVREKYLEKYTSNSITFEYQKRVQQFLT